MNRMITLRVMVDYTLRIEDNALLCSKLCAGYARDCECKFFGELDIDDGDTMVHDDCKTAYQLGIMQKERGEVMTKIVNALEGWSERQ